MDYRTLGRTGLRVGALGFGCGNVGGLLIRGTPAERERAVARALELGIISTPRRSTATASRRRTSVR